MKTETALEMAGGRTISGRAPTRYSVGALRNAWYYSADVRSCIEMGDPDGAADLAQMAARCAFLAVPALSTGTSIKTGRRRAMVAARARA